MKKVFVSVPFAGRTFREIMQEMSELETAYINEHGVSPQEISTGEVRFVDNYKVGALTENMAKASKIPNLVYLGEALRKMADCDDVIFSKNWESARGCRIEHLAWELYMADNSKD